VSLPESVTVTTRAVALYRPLAAAGPDSERDLGDALDYLGTRLAALGRHEEAIAPARESAGIFRRLADGESGRFSHAVAIAHDNLGNHLWNAGQREEAIAVAEECVRLYQPLADADPGAFTARLAWALDRLADRLFTLKRAADSLVMTRRQVAAWRWLLASEPAGSASAGSASAYQAELARTLYNLSVDLEAVGQPEDAAQAASESFDRYRDLAAAQPEVYEAALSQSRRQLAQLRPADSGQRRSRGLWGRRGK
jgi:tetratricopeptide (TPR) repeat protein